MQTPTQTIDNNNPYTILSPSSELVNERQPQELMQRQGM